MAAIPYDDMLMNIKLKRKSSNPKIHTPQPIEREFVELAREIYTYYPEVLSDKDVFINHITEYIKKGLQDFRRAHSKMPTLNSFVDLNIDSNAEKAKTDS
jgi:hypothetical protein